MKIFTKRLALVMGLLFTALICCGIVYIDTTQNFWSVSGGFVRLTVSNTFSAITISTNTPHGFGYNTNNSARSFHVVGRVPADTVTGNGASSATPGQLMFQAGNGGNAATNALAATGGVGGPIQFTGGLGGSALNTTSNSTGGAGGSVNFDGGAGSGAAGSVATNTITGGLGGAFTVASGAGGAPSGSASNTIGGAGGQLSFTTAFGATPTGGTITRRGGNGGAISFTAGGGGTSTGTNGANGGPISFTAGAATAGGAAFNPGAPGTISFTAGAGSTGVTNSDGGNIYLLPGAPGSGAVPGNVVIGRNIAGAAQGGLQVGPIVAGTTATLTNLLTITATLDFPSIAAGTVADLNVAFAGAADGDVVTLAVPLSAVTNCTWMAFASNAVVYVRCHNGQLVTAQDPNSGVFRIKVEKYR